VTFESISAYFTFVCCKRRSRTPWRWRRQTPKSVGVKSN